MSNTPETLNNMRSQPIVKRSRVSILLAFGTVGDFTTDGPRSVFAVSKPKTLMSYTMNAAPSIVVATSRKISFVSDTLTLGKCVSESNNQT